MLLLCLIIQGLQAIWSRDLANLFHIGTMRRTVGPQLPDVWAGSCYSNLNIK